MIFDVIIKIDIVVCLSRLLVPLRVLKKMLLACQWDDRDLRGLNRGHIQWLGNMVGMIRFVVVVMWWRHLRLLCLQCRESVRIYMHAYWRVYVYVCTEDKERQSKRSYISVFVCLFLSYSEPKLFRA